MTSRRTQAVMKVLRLCSIQKNFTVLIKWQNADSPDNLQLQFSEIA